MNDRQRRARTEAAARECAPDEIDRQITLLQEGFKALQSRYPEGLLRKVVRAGGRETEIVAKSQHELDALAARVVTLFGAAGDGATRAKEKRG